MPEPHEFPAGYKPGRYAAIDIGTVTARLLVVDVSSDGTLEELHKDHAICNLGVGVDRTGRLDPAAIARVEGVVRRFTETIARLQSAGGAPVVVTANATSASRDAENAGDFVAALAALGVDLSVIPGEREAALSFAGASSAFPGERVVVLDIGGGSTEVIAGAAGAQPQLAHSFDIGCRRVTERCFHDDPPTAGQLAAAGAWIGESMRAYLGEVVAAGYGGCRVAAVAGTATSVISMREQMEVYDSARVHGACASRGDVSALLGSLAAMTEGHRRQVIGLDPGRAPVIVAGLLILRTILDEIGAESFTVSECDILHGIVLDAAKA